MSSADNKSTSGHQSESESPDAEAPVGTEAARAGGVEPAKRQAQKDWENSSKESGE